MTKATYPMASVCQRARLAEVTIELNAQADAANDLLTELGEYLIGCAPGVSAAVPVPMTDGDPDSPSTTLAWQKIASGWALTIGDRKWQEASRKARIQAAKQITALEAALIAATEALL